jgi:hypothetical protein
LTALAAVTSLAVMGTALAPPAAAAGDSATGQVYVIQGLSGRNLDVVVDGKVVLAAAAPKTIVGPLTLAAGDHQVSLRTGPTSVVDSRVAVAAGESLDVVAHPDATSGTSAALTSFRNDRASVAPGKVRLAVAHTAAAPPADITVDGKVLFSNVANSEALSVVVPAGTYTVAIVPAATRGDPILGPVDLPIAAGTLTRVFAIGDVRSGTMDAVVHALPVKVRGAGAPRQVQTGDGGQLATQFTADDQFAADDQGIWGGGPAGLGLGMGLVLAGAAAGVLVAAVVLGVMAARPWQQAGPDAPTPAAPEPVTPAPARGWNLRDGGVLAGGQVVPPVAAPDGSAVPGSSAQGRGTGLAASDAGPGDYAGFQPRTLLLPSGARAPIRPAGVRGDGTLAVPDDPAQVGWWTGGALPGERYGGVVLAGHVDSMQYGAGVLAEMLTVQTGAVITLTGPGGRSQAYRVSAVRQVDKARLAAGTGAFDQAVPGRLVLITCGGPFDRARHHYRDNVVVLASPIR